MTPSPHDIGSPCPACRHDVSEKFACVKGYDIFRCANCRMRWVFPLPTRGEILGRYTVEYFQGGGEGYRSYLRDEEVHRKTASKRLAGLQRHTSGGYLLDVGCAAGFFLDEARRSGFLVRGVELCAEMAYVAENRFGINVDTTDFSSIGAEDESFDVITLYNVLAHIESPTDTIRKARRLLRPGGLLVIETWDADSLTARLLGPIWPFYTPPSMLYFFGRTTLPRLLERAGFEIINATYGGKRISLDAMASVMCYKFPGRISRSVDAWIARSSNASKLSIPFSFGQLLTVFARQAMTVDTTSDTI